ncbi:transcriptional regulator [Brevundimonas sp. LM2]|uniref:helix-turn-helix domain-containing protein n=1 Tax=Brevundimonas sp. LM2 TaxID=1938605 RepID=UPI000983D944|nr:helix-turn-helix transcriptional regulator [Brevundimonas sp. LM2]AQR61684.1 transcriptional regulator [Brevundimonas sp. LM2]
MRLRGIVARNLRRLRSTHGVSQEELGARADVSGNYVGMLEREERSPTVDMLERLAAALDVAPERFFDRD